MSHNEQKQDGRRRRNEEIRARFQKIAEEMPCWMIAVLPESERSNVTDSDRAKCPCAGCVFRRMVTRTAKQPDRRELEVYPTTSEIQEAFSELLAVIERVRKYDAPGDTALPLLNVEILSSLGELKIHAERIEETYRRMHNQRTGLRVLTGGNTISSSNLLEQVNVGSKLHVWMVGVVESLDDNSMLMRFDMPRLSRNV
jgi:hypothetical protein